MIPWREKFTKLISLTSLNRSITSTKHFLDKYNIFEKQATI